MLAMSSLMMPVPMLGASQLVHKPPEAKLLAIHSAHNQQPQATPQHHMQQTIHMPQQQQQQMQQQQSKPGSAYILTIIQNVSREEKKLFETGSRKELNKNANFNSCLSFPGTFMIPFHFEGEKCTKKFRWSFINSLMPWGNKTRIPKIKFLNPLSAAVNWLEFSLDFLPLEK